MAGRTRAGLLMASVLLLVLGIVGVVVHEPPEAPLSTTVREPATTRTTGASAPLSSSTTAASGTVTTSSEVEAVLLRLSDLPDGFSAAEDTGSGSGSDDFPDCTGGASAAPDPTASAPRAEAAFQSASSAVIEAAAVVDEAVARTVFDRIRTAYACDSFEDLDGATVEVTKLATAALGDETVGFRLAGPRYRIDVVAARRGGVLVAVFVVGHDFDGLLSRRLTKTATDRAFGALAA